MDLGRIDEQIKNAEDRIAQLACRINLVNTEAFQVYQEQAVRPQVAAIEHAILTVRQDGPPSEYELGVLQGQRQALLGLTFDEPQCQNAITELRAKIASLHEEKKRLSQKQSWHEPPERRGERPLYQEVDTTQPQGEWA